MRPGLPSEDKLKVMNNYYSQIPDMITSTVFTVEEIEQSENGRKKLNDLIKELNELRNSKITDMRVISQLHSYNIRLHEMVKRGKIVPN